MRDIAIYTDGSCEPNPGPGGWAFVAYEGGAGAAQRSGAAASTTNNRMELQAVLEALLWLAGRPATIYSDSQYAVNGIVSWSPAWKRRGWKRRHKRELVEIANMDLWQAIDAARVPGQRFVWVRGHAGNRGNEAADLLAGQARTLQKCHSVIQAV